MAIAFESKTHLPVLEVAASAGEGDATTPEESDLLLGVACLMSAVVLHIEFQKSQGDLAV